MLQMIILWRDLLHGCTEKRPVIFIKAKPVEQCFFRQILYLLSLRTEIQLLP
jgi:hypothetical protein